MVFLFIAYLGIIVFFISPLNIAIRAYKPNDGQKFAIFLQILFFNVKLPFPARKRLKKNRGKKKKKAKLKLTPNYKHLTALKSITIDKFLLEIMLDRANSAVFYPMVGAIAGINEFINYIGKYGDFSTINAVVGGRNYFQLQCEIRLNLAVIFSLFFQIIRLRRNS